MAETGSCTRGGSLARDWWIGRAEIDTSAPFESVKEAVDLFESVKTRKYSPFRRHIPSAEAELSGAHVLAIKEQTEKLEKELVLKERETLDVLKELEATKIIVDELKIKIKEKTSEKIQPSPQDEKAKESEKTKDEDQIRNSPKIKEEDERAKEEQSKEKETSENTPTKESGKSTSLPTSILEELKQAKFNLTRATSGLTDIKSSLLSLTKQIEIERGIQNETRERISKNSSKITELEKELHQTRLMIQFSEINGCGSATYPPDVSLELHKLNSEIDQYRRMAESGESEIIKLRAEIDQSRAAIKILDLRHVAAEKADTNIKAEENRDHSEPITITITKDEFEELIGKAREAEGISAERVTSATAAVEAASLARDEVMRHVEVATWELKARREALTKALTAAETAEGGKSAAEAALRRRRRRLLPDPALRPTLSIGEILSEKINGPSDLVAQPSLRSQPEISLGEVISSRKPKSKTGFSLARLTKQASKKQAQKAH